MGIHLNDYKVRFGDMSYGSLMHADAFFDLVIQGCEELSHEVDYTTEEVVAAGGVPYAPATVEMDVHRYPGYEDTISTVGRTLYVGEKSFGFEYAFERESDGRPLATAKMTHVTLTPEGDPEPLSDAVRANLEALREGPAEYVDHPDVPDFGEHPESDHAFERSVTYRTPMVEAVDFGYFEDYPRQMTIVFEEYLASLGVSIRDGSPDANPFFPTGGHFEFAKPIRFEDDVTVRGRIVSVGREEVVLQYEFVGNRGATDGRIRGIFPFGCFDADGERRPFPSGILDALPESVDTA